VVNVKIYKTIREDNFMVDTERIFNYRVLGGLTGLFSIKNGLFEYPAYLRWAETEDGDRILDSGSAFGSIFFASRSYKNLDLISMDVNYRMSRSAKKVKKILDYFSQKNKRYVIGGSSSQIPLDDASVNRVIDHFALVYVQDRKKTLEEYRRVLKPNGILIVMPAENDIIEAADSIFGSVNIQQQKRDFLYPVALKIVKK